MPRKQKTPEIPPPTAEERFAQICAQQGYEEEVALTAINHLRDAENARRRRDVMATWSEAKVARLIEAGKLTADDVDVWAAARRELLRRQLFLMFKGSRTPFYSRGGK